MPTEVEPPRRLLTGLLGYPVAHSASPAMHEAAGRVAGLDLRYHLIERSALDRQGLQAVLDGLVALGFAGINVTFPYKERVVPLLDGLSAQAAALGAVNTIVVRDGRLHGFNTDCTGFRTVCERLGAAALERPVALVGAGGAGRAMAAALLAAGAGEVRVYDVEADKARRLVDDLARFGAVRVSGSAAEAVRGAGGIVNATPVGMKDPDATPVDASLIAPGMWAADAVYVPLMTRFLREAHARGAKVVTGRELAIRQAVDAFSLMTGFEASEAAMAQAFDATIAPMPVSPVAA